MASLTVWKFDTAQGADEAVVVLKALAEQRLLVLEDAATVSWTEGDKKPRTRQLTGLTGAGALGGAFWGLLFGVIFFVPLVGAALGAAAGAISGSLSDAGIDDAFIHRIRDRITPGTSAVFLLSSDAVVDRVRDAFAGGGPVDLLFTNLSREQEDALRQVFTE